MFAGNKASVQHFKIHGELWNTSRMHLCVDKNRTGCTRNSHDSWRFERVSAHL